MSMDVRCHGQKNPDADSFEFLLYKKSVQNTKVENIVNALTQSHVRLQDLYNIYRTKISNEIIKMLKCM